MKKVRFLAIYWSDQQVVEITDEEFENWKNLSLKEQEKFMEKKQGFITKELIDIEINEEQLHRAAYELFY